MSHLRQRLLQDIDELCRKPYPNIELHVRDDDDLSRLCLVLSPPGWQQMHLSIANLSSYPLKPPEITMDSFVLHPNVFGRYICASILNDPKHYTPAYTLKSIAIQLLSFFGSNGIEQDYGDTVDLEQYRQDRTIESFYCKKCQFGQADGATRISALLLDILAATNGDMSAPIYGMPNEILLLVLEKLEDFEDLTSFARAWPRISQIIAEFDVLRQRELQCFVLKMSYHEVKLGVGVAAHHGKLSSEFDLLSQRAYSDLSIRQSVQGIHFSDWLPVPISGRHWRLVKNSAHQALDELKPRLRIENPTHAQVLYSFMSDIVVRLNEVKMMQDDYHASTSTLRHASEKAIESYFHLFHLLVCLATEDDGLLRQANRLLANFEGGMRSKQDCPNLAHLLVALLVSDVKVTDKLMKAIITEAITRNVVWLLNDNPELSYMETDSVSAYRLDKTFRGSRTSYRLLMFSELFRRTARPDNMSLAQVREQLFTRHGGPPPGAAGRLAAEVRRLHTVNDFVQFMREMGIGETPTAASFTHVLRSTLSASVEKKYSKWALRPDLALASRLYKEPQVGVVENLKGRCCAR
ncbi:hypothetical protein BJ170DRAFT_701197 [Xylariales sp. AK1849]|nr:hypothetical protein BJ170DRAFT_701197 [Xylariales sp. AK1849]